MSCRLPFLCRKNRLLCQFCRQKQMLYINCSVSVMITISFIWLSTLIEEIDTSMTFGSLKCSGEFLRKTMKLGASCILIITLVCVKLFVYEIVVVAGNSMYPTLKDGEILIVDKLDYIPAQSDIVLICKKTDSSDSEYLVKRIIAVGGETIKIDYEKNIVYVNDNVITEKYLYNDPVDLMIAENEQKIETFHVPVGCVFVMGDNRNCSKDSRSENIGYVHETDLIGKVICHFPFLNHQTLQPDSYK